MRVCYAIRSATAMTLITRHRRDPRFQLFLASRVRAFSMWAIGTLLVFHCAFWMTAMSPPLSLVSGALSLSFVAFPFREPSGYAT